MLLQQLRVGLQIRKAFIKKAFPDNLKFSYRCAAARRTTAGFAAAVRRRIAW